MSISINKLTVNGSVGTHVFRTIDDMIHEQTLCFNINELSVDWVFRMSANIGSVLNNVFNLGIEESELSECETLDQLASSSTAMEAIASSSTAMEAIASSSTAMEAIASSSTAMEAIASSSTAMEAIASSSTAMEAIASSSTAMEAIASSSTAMEAIASSSTAMEAIASSSTAIWHIANNTISRGVINMSKLNNESFFNACLDTVKNNSTKFNTNISSNSVNNSTANRYYLNGTTAAAATTWSTNVVVEDNSIAFIGTWYLYGGASLLYGRVTKDLIISNSNTSSETINLKKVVFGGLSMAFGRQGATWAIDSASNYGGWAVPK